jgi:flagellin
MIAGLTSSLALAQRTAAKARVTMDAMSRQIATGQKVASVKDDGAAWARAAGMKGQRVATDALRANLGRLDGVLGINAAATESRMAMLAPLADQALAAMDPSLSAATRAALQAAQNIPPGSAGAIGASAHEQLSTSGAAFSFNSLDADNGLAVLIDENGTSRTFQGSGLPTAPVGSTIDLSTPATAATARGLIMDSLALQRSRLAYWGSVQTVLERHDTYLSRRQDSLDAAIGSLTDADLGKASTARAQAETRQQLALDTVRNAINAYGAFAGGLLANAQRTQRSVLA